jgi:probable F420-dependent oxidoreductase
MMPLVRRREEPHVTMNLGRFGVWLQDYKLSGELAAEIERLGYGAIWVGSSPAADLRTIEDLLDATDGITVGTSIVNVWKDDAATLSESYHRLAERYRDRLLLGIGIGHPEQSRQYRSPYQTLVDYLDALDEGGVPVERRALAALGPRVLRLAGDRTAGALPYLTTPDHTRHAREILGPDALLVAEHKVVLDTDPKRARRLGMQRVASYLRLVNYTNNLRRYGFTDEDFAGSDRLVDALTLHGTAETVAAGLRAHLDAGANHVAVQPLTEQIDAILPALQTLAPALRGD